MLDTGEVLPKLLSGRYRLDEKLGQGGMGVVYRGVDLMMHHPVAVKLVRAKDTVRVDEAVAGRFLREAKHTSRIHHENIVEVLDLGRSETGDLFFVMELLEGETLSQLLRREQRVVPQRMVHIGAQVAEALWAAHEGGIVHRDLKPANIMLIARGKDPDFVKLLDFGVAKSHASGDPETQLTRTGMLVGTIEYMAPEQIMGHPVDGRTDIYSLGILLYRCITGSNPFRDPAMPAMINNHLMVTPEPMRSWLPEGVVPGALERVVQRCLQKEPSRRYPTMGEVAKALRGSLLPGVGDLPDLSAGDDDPYATDEATRVREPPGGPSKSGAPPSLGPRGFRNELELPLLLQDPEEVETRDGVGANDEPTRVEKPLRCAMCGRLNPPFAPTCMACGVTLTPPASSAPPPVAPIKASPADAAPSPPAVSGGGPGDAAPGRLPAATPGSGTPLAQGFAAPTPPSGIASSAPGSPDPPSPPAGPSPTAHGVPAPAPPPAAGPMPFSGGSMSAPSSARGGEPWPRQPPPPALAPPLSMWRRVLRWAGLG